MTARKGPGLSAEQMERRKRTRAFLDNPEAVNDCLEDLAEGVPLTKFCEARDFACSTVRHFLASTRPMEYEAVRTVVADGVLDEISELERKLADLLNNPPEIVHRDTASFYRELLKSKAWRVEKLNPARYGQRQNIDMRVTDTGKMQLDAIRELTRAKRAAIQASPPIDRALTTKTTSLPMETVSPSRLLLPSIPSRRPIPDEQDITEGTTSTVLPDDTDSTDETVVTASTARTDETGVPDDTSSTDETGRTVWTVKTDKKARTAETGKKAETAETAETVKTAEASSGLDASQECIERAPGSVLSRAPVRAPVVLPRMPK